MAAEKNLFVSDEQKLKIHLERNYTERFRMLMKLIRLNRKLKEVKIIEAKS